MVEDDNEIDGGDDQIVKRDNGGGRSQSALYRE